MTRLIALDTYKYGKTGYGMIAIDGDHKTVKVGIDWLKREIAPQTLDDFLSEYTFDESEHLYQKWLDEKGREEPHKVYVLLECVSKEHVGWEGVLKDNIWSLLNEVRPDLVAQGLEAEKVQVNARLCDPDHVTLSQAEAETLRHMFITYGEFRMDQADMDLPDYGLNDSEYALFGRIERYLNSKEGQR